jgi:hypothetical protein
MRPRRFVVALTAAAAVILSAPLSQQLFATVSRSWAPQSRALGIAATVVPIVLACAVAIARIRDRRAQRYLSLVCSLLIGGGYAIADDLSFTECFHFVEYGLLAWLFYRSWTAAAPMRGPGGEHLSRGGDRVDVLVLPLLAGCMVGTTDEWFQWFIPTRAGEARDIVLDVVASGCGLLFALGVELPHRLVLSLDKAGVRRVGLTASAAVVLFAAFVSAVHVGYEVHDARIGTFRARYSRAELAALSQDRARRWAVAPPIAQQMFAREDQYLTEGLWHVRQRNVAWADGDLSTAWRENLILETFYEPVLDTPNYASLTGSRWPPEQRAEAERRPGVDRTPVARRTYRYWLFVWPGLF